MTSDTIATTTPPPVTWAQKSSSVLLTFNVECEKPDIKIGKRSVTFKGICTPDKKLHEVEIPLYAEINPEKSSQNNKGRYIEIILVKEKVDQPFWPSLTDDKKKHHWLKIDFEHWQDENESGEEFDDANDMFSDKIGDFGDDIESGSEEDDVSDIK